MARLSKSKRDALKAAGEWSTSAEKDYSKDWAAGAAEFARLSNEANAALMLDDDDDCEYEPVFSPRVVPFFPDLFSAEDVYNAVVTEEVYPPTPIAVSPTVDQAMSFFFSMAAKATETASAGSAHIDVPTLVVTDTMAKYVSTLGEFQSGRFRFEFADLKSFVKTCLRSAAALFDGCSVPEAFRMFVMPVGIDDQNFRVNLSVKLMEWFACRGFHEVSFESMTRCLFNGFVPDDILHADPKLYDEYELIVHELFREVPSFADLQSCICRSNLVPLFRELGFHPEADLGAFHTLDGLCQRATAITRLMTPRSGERPGPFILPYGDDSVGDISQFVYERANGKLLVPKHLGVSERIEAASLRKVFPFRALSPTFELCGGRWIPVSMGYVHVHASDFEGFPKWREV